MLDKDWQIWGGCLLLFVSGTVTGLFASGSDMPIWVTSLVAKAGVSLSELVQMLASVILAAVGLYGLRSWREQTLFARRYDAFVRLNIALQDLDVFRAWAKALPDSHIRRYTKEFDDESDSINSEYISSLVNRIPTVWREYRLALYEAALHMSASDIESRLSVKYVRDNLVNPTRDLYNELESNYSGRRLSQEDWANMSGEIETVCWYVRMKSDEIITAGEKYIYRQLRLKV